MKILGYLLMIIIFGYSWLLVIRIVISLLKIPYAPWMKYIAMFTDPVINYFKKKYPIKIDKYDFSVLIPLTILFLLQIPIADLMIGGAHFSIFYLLALFIRIIKLVYTIFIFAVIISAVILLYINLTKYYTNNPIILFIKKLLTPVTNKIKKIFKLKEENADKYSLIILLVATIILGFILNYLFAYIIDIINKQQAANIEKNKLLENEFDIR